MSEDDDTLAGQADRATVKQLTLAKVGVVIAVLALAWTIFNDLVLSEPDPSSSADVSQSTSVSPSESESERDTQDESSDESVMDELGDYFARAAYDTEDWRAEHRIWQLVTWWLVSVILTGWLMLFVVTPGFRTAAIVQACYLVVFWPSLSGFGVGLSIGLAVLVWFVLEAFAADV